MVKGGLENRVKKGKIFRNSTIVRFTEMWPWLGAQGWSCKSGKGNTEDGNTEV